MRTDKYYSASAELAERGGFTRYRHRIETDRYLLSESDIRQMIGSGLVEIAELATLDIREVSASEADSLILEGKAEDTRRQAGVVAVESSEETDGSTTPTDDAVDADGEKDSGGSDRVNE